MYNFNNFRAYGQLRIQLYKVQGKKNTDEFFNDPEHVPGRAFHDHYLLCIEDRRVDKFTSRNDHSIFRRVRSRVPDCKGFMDTIPTSLREVAKMEGASELKIFFKIVLPICKPIIVYQIISSFLIPWGDFVFANLMLNSGISKDFTVAIGLYHMLDRSLINQYFAIFCAGGLVISIPIAILFVIMQKYYVAGVAAGSVKG